MAYNNYGVNYLPYNQPVPATPYLGQNLQYQQSMQPQQQQSGSIMTVFINSEDEVNGYPVAAGTTVLLLCFSAKKFWLKSTSTSGIPETLREFPFEEKIVAPQKQSAQSGVTRDEFNELSSKIDKLIADLGGGSNG